MDMEQSPGLLIHRLAHEMSVELHRRLKVHGITRSQWSVLMILWKGEGRSQTEIQEVLGLERATITGLIQRMSAQGWVQRRDDPHDGRVQRVFLTERSRALKPTATLIVEEVHEQVLAGFSEDERAFFKRLLLRALENLEGA